MAPLTEKEIPLFFHPAPSSPNAQKARAPLIVISHHFGGNAATSQRHVGALNGMGFDCVTFSFSLHGKPMRWVLPLNMMERWSHEIGAVLNQLDKREPGRPVILYSFSGPSASALATIVRGLQKNLWNIQGFICDSGPFTDAKSCTRLMIEQIYGIKMPLRREIALMVMMTMWGPGHNQKLKSSLETLSELRPDFPILSFRGLRDTIVPIDKIRRAFESIPLKNLTAIDLDCGHLTGLRDFPVPYKAALEKFLERWPC